MKYIYSQKGFSLVESLVAITILLVAVVGPMTIASQGLQASFFSREQTTAVYLAQEAIESIERLRTEQALSVINDDLSLNSWVACQVRTNVNDPNCTILNAWGWFDDEIDIDPACKSSTGCDLDITDGSYHSCSGDGACNLLFDEAAGAYSYDAGGAPSQFTRVIHLDDRTADEVAVTVTVSWQANLFGGTSQVVLQTSILNLYE